MLIDLHNHTYPKSDDSFMSADELVDGARAAGLDGVCLTEHDDFWAAEDAAELTRRHGILVLPGAEINTDAGHVLAFGLRRYRFGMHKPEFLRAEADREGAALAAAHPYRRRFLAEPGRDPEARAAMLERAAADPQLRLFDAIEAQNGRGSAAENGFAEDLRQRLALPGVGGSDAHRQGQIGTAATWFQRRIASLEDLIEELRAGRTQAVALAAASSGRGAGRGPAAGAGRGPAAGAGRGPAAGTGMGPAAGAGMGPAAGAGMGPMAGTGMGPAAGTSMGPMAGMGTGPMAGAGSGPAAGTGPMAGTGMGPMAGMGTGPMAGMGTGPMAGMGTGPAAGTGTAGTGTGMTGTGKGPMAGTGVAVR